MSEESDISEREAKDAGPMAGQRLAEARKAREISIFDIAKELHLDEFKVQALEENRFDVLGAPVFAKGHLRKYAELVGVSVDDMMADYATLNRAAGAPPVVGLPRKQSRDWQLGPWILSGLLLLIALAVAYWWLGRVPETSSNASATLNTVLPLESSVTEAIEIPDTTVETENEPAEEESSPVDPEPVPTAADDDSPEAMSPAAAAPVAARPATSGSAVSLSMTFSGDCWTEVSDATGARLFFDLGREGRTLNVSGEAPLRVLFGNSDNVTVSVDGRSYPITNAMRRGQTARLTISKP